MGTGDVNPLLRTSRFLRRNADTSSGGWSALTPGQRGAQSFYRDRWQRDKVVRSTPGVNCTGSCSWNVYVKDGIITRETQQTDYPSNGPDMPDTRRAAVRAVLRSPGIRTHRCASAGPAWSRTQAGSPVSPAGGANLPLSVEHPEWSPPRFHTTARVDFASISRPFQWSPPGHSWRAIAASSYADGQSSRHPCVKRPPSGSGESRAQMRCLTLASRTPFGNSYG